MRKRREQTRMRDAGKHPSCIQWERRLQGDLDVGSYIHVVMSDDGRAKRHQERATILAFTSLKPGIRSEQRFARRPSPVTSRATGMLAARRRSMEGA
jgi:hypothetical protein